MPGQVSHPGSWILENCALGFVARLFFEVAEMKALQAVATPLPQMEVAAHWVGGSGGQRVMPLTALGRGGGEDGSPSAHPVEANPNPPCLLKASAGGWLAISELASKPQCLPTLRLVAQCTWARGSPDRACAPHYPGLFGGAGHVVDGHDVRGAV